MRAFIAIALLMLVQCVLTVPVPQVSVTRIMCTNEGIYTPDSSEKRVLRHAEPSLSVSNVRSMDYEKIFAGDPIE